MVKKNYVKGEFIFENNLKTNGTMGIGAYTFPNTDGSNGQALLTDGSGTVTWSDVSGGGNTEDGTADGEMLYWDNTASEYKHTETSELYWDDTNKYFSVGTASPVNKFEVDGLIKFDDTKKNVILGTNALSSVTSGIQNVAIGRNALSSVTSGSYNIGIGDGAADAVTTANNTIGIGYGAMGSVTTGSSNIGIGNLAGLTMTTGYSNTAIGNNSQRSATGSSNTGIGSGSLRYSTGSNNTGIGSGALSANRGGVYNTGIGNGAVSGNEDGHRNVGIGWGALGGVGGGDNFSDNIGIGHTVAYNIGNTEKNTLIGSLAARYLTTGASNIFLGYKAGFRQTTNSNLLIIDNQQRTDAATEATNAIIYGTMASTPANQTLSLNAVTTFAQGVKSSDGSAGITTTFTNGDGDTVTVKDGLITSVA